MDQKVVVIIPALNEEKSIGLVLSEIPAAYAKSVVVVDNGSTDRTRQVARQWGATVLDEPRRGYGQACLTGLRFAENYLEPDLYVFLDADYSDHPPDMNRLLLELNEKRLDMVIGSRMGPQIEKGALLPQAQFGNRLATWLLDKRYGFRFTDLGPFRAITANALRRLHMCDTNFGWTMEMQVKALRLGMRVGEIPVHYKKRVGVSKITGTVTGTVRAGYKILWTFARHSLPRKMVRGLPYNELSRAPKVNHQ